MRLQAPSETLRDVYSWMDVGDWFSRYVVKELASHLIDFSVSRLRLRIGVILAPWRSAVGPKYEGLLPLRLGNFYFLECVANIWNVPHPPQFWRTPFSITSCSSNAPWRIDLLQHDRLPRSSRSSRPERTTHTWSCAPPSRWAIVAEARQVDVHQVLRCHFSLRPSDWAGPCAQYCTWGARQASGTKQRSVLTLGRRRLATRNAGLTICTNSRQRIRGLLSINISLFFDRRTQQWGSGRVSLPTSDSNYRKLTPTTNPRYSMTSTIRVCLHGTEPPVLALTSNSVFWIISKKLHSFLLRISTLPVIL